MSNWLSKYRKLSQIPAKREKQKFSKLPRKGWGYHMMLQFCGSVMLNLVFILLLHLISIQKLSWRFQVRHLSKNPSPSLLVHETSEASKEISCLRVHAGRRKGSRKTEEQHNQKGSSAQPLVGVLENNKVTFMGRLETLSWILLLSSTYKVRKAWFLGQFDNFNQ